MLRRFAFILFYIQLTLFASAKPVTYIWDLGELDSLRHIPSSAAYQSYIQKADQALRTGVVAVTDKENSISGEKHNYESLSVYWWADPQNPDGPYIARDGEFNPEYKQYDYPRLQQLVENMRACSKAFYLTGELEYFSFFCRQLDTWFINEDTRMQPDFNYCQFIPGRNGNRGNPQGMIDAYNFNEVIESIRLVHHQQSIGRKRMKALKAWFSAFAEWMQTSDYGKKASAFKNNQAVAYDVTLYDFFLFTGKKSARRQILDSFYVKRLMAQIDEEGKMVEELTRTRAYDYSIFNLIHLIDFCFLVQSDGQSVPAAIITKIEKSITYLSRFADQPEVFPYKEMGDWKQMGSRLKRERLRFNSFARRNRNKPHFAQ